MTPRATASSNRRRRGRVRPLLRDHDGRIQDARRGTDGRVRDPDRRQGASRGERATGLTPRSHRGRSSCLRLPGPVLGRRWRLSGKRSRDAGSGCVSVAPGTVPASAADSSRRGLRVASRIPRLPLPVPRRDDSDHAHAAARAAPLPRRRLRADLSRVLRAHLAPADARAAARTRRAAWGIVNFLQRLLATHKPDYLGWVHDCGLLVPPRAYPDYKATREKLTEELQADFDRGMERICAAARGVSHPDPRAAGLRGRRRHRHARAAGRARRGSTSSIVSGDKDFQQLVRPGVWLLNPGRGGPASVEEQWVGVENGSRAARRAARARDRLPRARRRHVATTCPA